MMKHTISLSLLLTVLNISCGSKKHHDNAPAPANPVTPATSLVAKPSDRADKVAGLVEDLRKKLDIIPRKDGAKKAPATLTAKFAVYTAKVDEGKGGDEEGDVFTRAGDHDCQDALPEFDGLFKKLQDNFVQPIQNIIKETDKTKLQNAVTKFWNDTHNVDVVIASENDSADEDDQVATETPEDPFDDLSLFDVSAELATEKTPVKVTFTPKKGDVSEFLPTATFEAGNNATGLYSKSVYAQHLDFGSLGGILQGDEDDKAATKGTDLTVDTKVTLNFTADLIKSTIKNGFAFTQQAKGDDGDKAINLDQAINVTFEVGGQDKPYIRQELAVKISGADEDTNVDGTLSQTIEKTKDNQLTVTTVTKEGKEEATFIGRIDIAADKTCKFNVAAAKK